MNNLTNFQDVFRYYVQLNADSDDNAKKNLDEISKELGYRSASSLSMLATGKRLPSKKLLEQLMKLWKISPLQKKILRLQVEIDRKNKKGKDTLQLLTELKKADPEAKYTGINFDAFESVKEWYFLAIQNFVGAPDFTEDTNELSRLFRRKVSPAKIRDALAKLQKLGLIKRNPKTKKLEKSFEQVETTHDIPSEAIRTHHKGMIQLALQAIDEQSIEERMLNSLTFRVAKSDVPEIKKQILNFAKKINERYSNENSNHIYQLNSQLFELTDSDCLNKKEQDQK